MRWLKNSARWYSAVFLPDPSLRPLSHTETLSLALSATMS